MNRWCHTSTLEREFLPSVITPVSLAHTPARLFIHLPFSHFIDGKMHSPFSSCVSRSLAWHSQVYIPCLPPPFILPPFHILHPHNFLTHIQSTSSTSKQIANIHRSSQSHQTNLFEAFVATDTTSNFYTSTYILPFSSCIRIPTQSLTRVLHSRQ